MAARGSPASPAAGVARPVDGIAAASDQTLLRLRDNLLEGLERVAAALANGTFRRVGRGGQAPPSESGCLTLALLAGVNDELVSRGYDTVFRER